MVPDSRQKGPDEMFCRSCGEPIKIQAEICPHCGVRNEQGKSSSGGQRSTQTTKATTASHDPSQYNTTVSGNWYYLIAGSVAAWIVTLVFSSASPTNSALGTLAGFIGLIAWFAMPVAIYFDKQYLRANSKWNPNVVLWVFLAIIPLLNIVAGAVFLYRRHEVLGVP